MSETVRTLPAALVIDSVALLPPADVEWKPTATEVDSPPASAVAPGTPTLNSLAFVPAIANGSVSVAGAASSFVIVIDAAADAPMSTEPKS